MATKKGSKKKVQPKKVVKKVSKVPAKKGTVKAKKRVYFFGNKKAEGKTEMRNLLGGKGANLAEMTNIGVPVPPGFTITTETCIEYYTAGKKFPAGLDDEMKLNIAKVEQIVGMQFGSPTNPLLFSVRSGARVSMPGMMDTILNLGLNDEAVKGLAARSGNARFANDSYRRFIQMFGDVVKGVDHDKFEHILSNKKQQRGVKQDTDLNAEDLADLIVQYKALYKAEKGKDFPQDPMEQLRDAIGAVFGSWETERAVKYRKLNGISDDWGTAVNVQAMVFGNLGETSGTGVAFTRNPSTGERKFYGEYLMNAQGEDVVAGIRTPHPISSLAEVMPAAYKELVAIYQKLEKHYRDMQDIEFTIQDHKLYLLQTRNGKRTAFAAVRIAVEMVKEKLIDMDTAILRVAPSQLDQLLHPMIDPKSKYDLITKGLPASPGAAVGRAVFSADEAEVWKARGEKVILVRNETSPEDIGGMDAAQGILTARGGMTSHAAVVARGMGKCCVAGAGSLEINDHDKQFKCGHFLVKEGDLITLNGSTGEVINGALTLIEPELSGEFSILMKWADKVRRLKVRANADTPHDAANARKFGAEGIGLCRTEHMFFEGERIKAMREMILANTVEQRELALAKLLPMQKGDFLGLFKEMAGYPVTIRLLDPPLHEFLPQNAENQEEMAREMGISAEQVKAKVEALHELNPMLGHRGCRLAITYPEIAVMQSRAIIEAAIEIKKGGQNIIPEIMIPLVGKLEELTYLKKIIVETADKLIKSAGVKMTYMVGTMIEVPRAALIADKLAVEAEFFSFGTNDLTQMTFGFSRDDAGVFIKDYLEKKVLKDDPFQTLDQEGVGQLVATAVKLGRSARPDIKVGICGEHGGDPASVEFCHRTGLNYVSCSPFRVPIARLAAAHAVLKEKKSK